eukprot:scaffold8165_cov19-Prasinocladus_malaysianus.AAC.1
MRHGNMIECGELSGLLLNEIGPSLLYGHPVATRRLQGACRRGCEVFLRGEGLGFSHWMYAESLMRVHWRDDFRGIAKSGKK